MKTITLPELVSVNSVGAAGRAGRPMAAAGTALGRLGRMVALWRERARQRRALAELDDRLLRDIGLSRADAVREAAVPFWR